MHRHTLPRLSGVSTEIRHTLSRQKSTLPKPPPRRPESGRREWDGEREQFFDGRRPDTRERPPSKRRASAHVPQGSEWFFKRSNEAAERFADPSTQTRRTPVAKALQNVLSPEACALLGGTRLPPKSKSKVAEASLRPAQSVMPPSMERLAFDASDMAPDATPLPEVDDPDVFSGEVDKRFSAGTYVEIRRNAVRAVGVVLFTILLDRKWTVHTLTDRGEVWPHQEHDVQFQIPGFVDKKLAEACGIMLTPATEAEMDARVRLLVRMRQFGMQFEDTMHTTLEKARAVNFYDKVAHPDSKSWRQITIHDAAEALFGSRVVSPGELLAAQTLLMDDGTHYVAEQRRFLKQQTFWVRPREEVEVIQAMHKMALENDPAVDAFAEKARSIVLASRQRAVESFNEPPSRHPLEGFELTEKDKTILRFLRASLRAMRHIQTEPFSTPFSQILKKTGLYDLELYDESSVHTLLSEMGVLAPWQETVTRDGANWEEREVVDLQPSGTSPLVPEPVGPQDLYQGDVVDNLRHDFGHMPVYVVDDWNAEELDDGLSIERIPSDPDHVWLHVHVADPTTLLPPTHEIARSAFRLSTTNYLLDRTVRMLPREAGFNQFSLGHEPGQPDKVLTFSVKVDSEGEIADYQVRAAMVRNVRILKYDMVDAALGVSGVKTQYPFTDVRPKRPSFDPSVIDPATAEDLRLLHQTTRKLLRSRVRKGAITMCLPQIELQLNPRPLSDDILGTPSLTPYAFRGFPDITYGILDTQEAGARQVIAESMKAACRVASLFFRDRGIPALRRSVGAMQSELVGGVEAVMAQRDEEGFVIDYYSTVRNLVSAPAGRYLTTPGPHMLLGVPDGEGYVKVTSPLRRFGDLFAHWQIKHALLAEVGEAAGPVLFPEDWLARFGDELETRELGAKRAERVQMEYWAHLFVQRWMADPAAGSREDDPMQRLTGRLLTTPNLNTRTRDHNCIVYIPELGMKSTLVDLPQDVALGLGDAVDVKVKLIKLGMRPMIEVVLR